MNRAALDWSRTTLLALDPADLTPDALLFLLRDYVSDGAESVRAAAEHGLTHALRLAAEERDACRRIEWLRALAEAAALSPDERLQESLRRWLPDAVDALESYVRHSYEPGDGLVGRSCQEHLRCSSALLAAFDLAGRLPYAMLAEELLRFARARWWRRDVATFDADFAANCDALHVCCTLAALHLDPHYRSAAVLAPGSAYGDDARGLAEALMSLAGEHPHGAGALGRGLLEWFALESNLQ